MIAGYVTSSIILSVSTSAVQAILVCFAESPHQLQLHYSDLSSQIQSAMKEDAYMSDHSNYEYTVEFSKMSDTNDMIRNKIMHEV